MKDVKDFASMSKWVYYGIIFYGVYLILDLWLNYSMLGLFFRIARIIILCSLMSAAFDSNCDRILKLIIANLALFFLEIGLFVLMHRYEPKLVPASMKKLIILAVIQGIITFFWSWYLFTFYKLGKKVEKFDSNNWLLFFK